MCIHCTMYVYVHSRLIGFIFGENVQLKYYQIVFLIKPIMPLSRLCWKLCIIRYNWLICGKHICFNFVHFVNKFWIRQWHRSCAWKRLRIRFNHFPVPFAIEWTHKISQVEKKDNNEKDSGKKYESPHGIQIAHNVQSVLWASVYYDIASDKVCFFSLFFPK